jgi:PhnB protein
MSKRPVQKKKKATPKTKKTRSIRSKTKRVQRKKKVSALPKGYHSITPYLIVHAASKAIEFYKKAFAAKEVIRIEHAGKIKHAELKIGDAKIMLADECPEMKMHVDVKSAPALSIHLYVKNVDQVVEHAVKLGAKLIRPVEDRFYGDRNGMLEDPYGHQWCISTHVENVSPAKMKKRAAELFSR